MSPACADHGAELVIFLEPVGEELDAHGLRAGFYGGLDRNGVHSYARASRRYHLRGELERFLRSEVEHGRDFGMIVAEGRMFHHVFSGTDYPLGDPVLDVMVFVVPVLFEYADPDQVVYDLLRLGDRHVVHRGELGSRIAYAALLEAEHELDFLLGEEPVEDPEIEMILLQSSGDLAVKAVGYHFRELFHEFFLLGIVAVMVALIRVVPVVNKDILVYFLNHNSLQILESGRLSACGGHLVSLLSINIIIAYFLRK